MSRTLPAFDRPTSRGPEWDATSRAVRDRDAWVCNRCGGPAAITRRPPVDGFACEACGSHDGGVGRHRCTTCEAHDAIWACHMLSWSQFPDHRYDMRFIVSMCPRCDPDRNPAARPKWWGTPAEPVRAGWERRERARRRQHHGLRAFARWAIATALWLLALRADAVMPWAPAPTWGYDLGLRFLAALVGAWLGIYVVVVAAARWHVAGFVWRQVEALWRR